MLRSKLSHTSFSSIHSSFCLSLDFSICCIEYCQTAVFSLLLTCLSCFVHWWMENEKSVWVMAFAKRPFRAVSTSVVAYGGLWEALFLHRTWPLSRQVAPQKTESTLDVTKRPLQIHVLVRKQVLGVCQKKNLVSVYCRLFVAAHHIQSRQYHWL